jgi:membrane protein YdbS with pleckstrin-like domain
MFAQNMGGLDRAVRLLIGAVAATLPAWGVATGGWIWLAFAVAAVMIVTAAIGVCPLYRLFGLDTRPKLMA